MATKTKSELIKAGEEGFTLGDTFALVVDGKQAGNMSVQDLVTEITTVTEQAYGVAQHMHSMALAVGNIEGLQRTFSTIEAVQQWHSGRGKPKADAGTIPAPFLYTQYKSKILAAATAGVLWGSKSLNDANTKLARITHQTKKTEQAKAQKAHQEKARTQAEIVHNLAEGSAKPEGDLPELFKAAQATAWKVWALLDLEGQRNMVKEFASLTDKFSNLAELNQAAQRTEANQAAAAASQQAASAA